jgi:hypothetical protein
MESMATPSPCEAPALAHLTSTLWASIRYFDSKSGVERLDFSWAQPLYMTELENDESVFKIAQAPHLPHYRLGGTTWNKGEYTSIE